MAEGPRSPEVRGACGVGKLRQESKGWMGGAPSWGRSGGVQSSSGGGVGARFRAAGSGGVRSGSAAMPVPTPPVPRGRGGRRCRALPVPSRTKGPRAAGGRAGPRRGGAGGWRGGRGRAAAGGGRPIMSRIERLARAGSDRAKVGPGAPRSPRRGSPSRGGVGGRFPPRLLHLRPARGGGRGGVRPSPALARVAAPPQPRGEGQSPPRWGAGLGSCRGGDGGRGAGEMLAGGGGVCVHFAGVAREVSEDPPQPLPIVRRGLPGRQ